ncbi:unnamed protein product [Dimorphilus gyrociliatus]|uniref:BZIP domain-containing protein n=1 Tax=Dimorphilus gyrociliatus TaxID=2664684 RepID=A0A7I8VUL5_9ANNE|nr:unnamed protein product [Dimorphilus gyrociliatus]
MSLPELIDDWTLFGEFSSLSNPVDIEPDQFTNATTTTLQCLLKCQDGHILNGSYNSDEVVQAVSPVEGLSPLGTPPTSPSQAFPLNDGNELSDLLSGTDFDIDVDVTERAGCSTDDYIDTMLDFELEMESTLQITKEDASIIQDAFELRKVCEALDEAPESPKSVRSHPYKVPSYEKHLDKKLRKKQQNKDAAIRYRLKKKAQKQVQGGELEELMDINKNLKSECKEKMREIEYLKELLQDVCKAKGIEPPNQCITL